MPIVASDYLNSTSEDSDDSESTRNLLRKQWLNQHSKSIKALHTLFMNSDCTSLSDEMLPFAAVSSSSSSSANLKNTPKRNNKRRNDDTLASYQMLDSRISSSSMASPLPIPWNSPSSSVSASSTTPHNINSSSSSTSNITGSGGKRRKRNQNVAEHDESQEYIDKIQKTYCYNEHITMPNSTIVRYASINDMLLTNELLYTTLWLNQSNTILETACLHCRNLSNIDLLEWSEAVLIQLCEITNNYLLNNTWNNVIHFVGSAEWGPKMSLNLQRIYGQSICLSNILTMNHAMKIEKYNMPEQFVFRENRIPPLNMQLLRTIPRCDGADLEKMNLRQTLSRLPIVVRKKKNV